MLAYGHPKYKVCFKMRWREFKGVRRSFVAKVKLRLPRLPYCSTARWLYFSSESLGARWVCRYLVWLPRSCAEHFWTATTWNFHKTFTNKPVPSFEYSDAVLRFSRVNSMQAELSLNSRVTDNIFQVFNAPFGSLPYPSPQISSRRSARTASSPDPRTLFRKPLTSVLDFNDLSSARAP